MAQQAQNIKTVDAKGQTTYFSGDLSNIPSLGDSQIYNAPLPGGGFYSGVASGYGQGVSPASGGVNVTQGNAPTGAVKSTGGYWVVPGSDQYYSTAPSSKDGAVGSGDVMTGQSQQGAVSSATSALTGNNSTPLPSWAQTLLAGMQSADSQYKDLNSKIYQSIGASYDANLAANSAQYADLFNQLAAQHTNEVQSGTARAIALNPYSQDKQASTAAGYTQSLNKAYQTQYNSLTAKMQAAQAQLAAGKTDAYLKLTKEAADESSDFQKNMANFTSSIAQMSQTQANADRNYNLSVAEKGQGDFNTLLTNLSGSKELQADIDTYEKTGTISPGLQQIVDKGAQAGMSPTEALSVFNYQSQNVRTAEATENYRNQQLILSQERIANAQINAQVKIATMQGLQQTSAALIASGKQPGTLDYATGLAGATVGSKQSLPSSQVGTYTNIGILASQLDGLKAGIQSIDKNSDVWNIVNTNAGRTVSSMTDADLAVVNSKIQALSGILGKSVFGESGNLSNSDIGRILGNLPNGGTSSVVRDALYNQIVDTLAKKAIITLQNDASNGYNVSAYAPSVKAIVDKAGTAQIGSNGTFDYNTWAKANGLQ